MSRFKQNQHSSREMPGNKRPRVGSTSGESSGAKFARNRNGANSDEDDDPFADDLITGEELEEWENIATQAEVQLTQDRPRGQHNGHHKLNGASHGHGAYSFKSQSMGKGFSGDNFNNVKHKDGVMKDLRAKLDAYEKKVKELEQSYTRKDGETRILRDRLTKTEKDLSQEKFKILEMQKQHASAEENKEKQIQKEIEKYKDQVQFKHAEVLESQNLIRNLEAKNKVLLESQKARPGVNSPSCSKSNFSDVGWTNSQDVSAVKKIRLVKPESPRIQVAPLKKATFDDEPLGRKKAAKSSPIKPSTSATEVSLSDAQKTSVPPVCLASFAKMKLRSKYVSKGMQSQTALKDLFRTAQEYKTARTNKTQPPILDLLNVGTSARDKHAQDSALEGVRKLLSAPVGDSRTFRYLTGAGGDNTDAIQSEGFSQFFSVIKDALEAYVTLLSGVTCGDGASLDPSFHSAVSSSGNLAHARLLSDHVSPASCIPKCNEAYAAINALQILINNSTQLKSIVVKNSSIMSHLLKLCDSSTWDLRLSHCKAITSCALRLVQILSNSSETGQEMAQFSPLMKNEVLLPLIINDDVAVACHAVEMICSMIRHRPFAVILVTEDKAAECASLLYHICAICWTGRSRSCMEEEWLKLLSKVMKLLSALVSQHECLLVEHSCYSEIYHAADVLLYNQLVLWKKDTEIQQKRVNLIRQAICLLYSCTNVYTEGIPGNRREHRHLVVLTELELFLAKHGDQTSFWCQELHRTVKSEVNSVFEEVEVT